MSKKLMMIAALLFLSLNSGCAAYNEMSDTQKQMFWHDISEGLNQFNNSLNQSSQMMYNQTQQLQQYNQQFNSNPFRSNVNCRVVPMGYTTTIQCY